MSDFTVYGLRLKGEYEVRYIGQTKDAAARLSGHRAASTAGWMYSGLDVWLIQNGPAVEWIEIGRAESREDARRQEREAVKFCLSLGHRLFNLHLVPADKRIIGRTPASDVFPTSPHQNAA